VAPIFDGLRKGGLAVHVPSLQLNQLGPLADGYQEEVATLNGSLTVRVKKFFLVSEQDRFQVIILFFPPPPPPPPFLCISSENRFAATEFGGWGSPIWRHQECNAAFGGSYLPRREGDSLDTLFQAEPSSADI